MTNNCLQTTSPPSKILHAEPIAIIGMGCRFPGGADNPEAFWRLLRDGVDTVTEVPADRWDVNAYADPASADSDEMGSRYGGFIDGLYDFDAQFFNIAPREAVSLDPQQRLLLEVCWESLEHGGVAPDTLVGSQTGVFVGISGGDHAIRMLSRHASEIDAYFGSGSAASVASGRLSYFLGLQGPNLAVDTACSSSLVAIHLACQNLRYGTCNLALAGGVSRIILPQGSLIFAKAHMLAPDGHCKTFDASANGYVRAEGCGMIVLKRLSDALTDGDYIWAVIRSSAVNHGGRTTGLTVPGQIALQQVITQALEAAGLEPAQISYVEAHGTGTPVGDAVELNALGTVFHDSHSHNHPLIIGAVKTNIGHAEPASGITALIKVVMAMQYQEIPPNLHFHQPNPNIPWDEFPLKVPTERIPWPIGDKPRIAGMNSLGFGGTIAHVILEEAPPEPQTATLTPVRIAHATLPERSWHILTLSAKTDEALKSLASRYEHYLADNAHLGIGDICFSANTGRSHFDHRLSVLAQSSAEAREKLASFAAGQHAEHIVNGQTSDSDRPKIAFLFTGQGAQYVGMGRQLYETQPIFRQALDHCATILTPYLESPLLSILYPDSEIVNPTNDEVSKIDLTLYAQPAIFALEYALVKLWQAWGIEADMVMGHSIGEYIAACIAGIFSLEDGLRMIAERARLMQALPQNGDMAAVFADEAHVAAAIAPYAQRISLAAINSPAHCVISGEKQAVQDVITTLAAKGIDAVKLRVSHAFHSALMEPILPDFERTVNTINFSLPQRSLVSTVTGQLANEDMSTAAYWTQQIRQPVHFVKGMQTLRQQGCDIVLEIGPHPTLIKMGSRCVAEGEKADESSREEILWLSSLHREETDWQHILQNLAELYVSGGHVDWPGFDQEYTRRKVLLPPYPFQRKSYRPNIGASSPTLAVISGAKPLHGKIHHPSHPLLGYQFDLAGSQELRFESQLSSEAPRFLNDHRVYDVPILPATAYLEMALAAGVRLFKTDHLVIENLLIQQALLLSPDETKTVQFVLRPEDANNASFEIFSLGDETSDAISWIRHASGHIRTAEDGAVPGQVVLAALQQQCPQSISIEAHYQQCQTAHIGYGPDFQALESIWAGEKEALGLVVLPERLMAEMGAYKLHPVLLDACFQISEVVFTTGYGDETYLPIEIRRLSFYHTPGSQVWSHAQVYPAEEAHPEILRGDIYVLDGAGQILVEIEGLSVKRTRPEALLPTKELWQNWLYEVLWQPQARPCPAAPYLMTVSEEIRTTLTSQFVLLRDQAKVELYHRLMAQLEKLSIAYIVRAFQHLGWTLQEGERVSVESIVTRSGIIARYVPLVHRLFAILTEEGILRKSDQQWEIIKTADIHDPHHDMQNLWTEYAFEAEVLTLFERCGSQLADVLCGKTDPLQLLFPGGDLSTVTQLYQDSSEARVMNTLNRQVIAGVLAQVPPGNRIRILEVGAGTGGATSSILPYLPPHQTEYLFTDISPLFLNNVREKFQNYPFVHYQVLDIEKSPQAQGFDFQGYDVVLAANVLHTTSDLRQTLSHIQDLLAPKGVLVLIEATTRRRWVDLIFGLMEGWWKFHDYDLRPDYPLLSPALWRDVLLENGFAQVISVPSNQEDPDTQFPQTVIVAQKAEMDTEASPNISGNWLIFADQQGLGQQLASLRDANRGPCHLVFPGETYTKSATGTFTVNPDHPDDFERLFIEIGANTTAPLQQIVHLWSLDTAIARELTPDRLQDAASLCVNSTLHLIQVLLKADIVHLPSLWLVTRGAQQAGGRVPTVPGLAQSPVWGLGKVINLEHPNLECTRIDLAPEAVEHEAQTLFAEIQYNTSENQVAFRDMGRYVPRLSQRGPKSKSAIQKFNLPPNQPYCLEITERGTFESLALQPIPRRQPAAGEVEIHVHATGLNFIDILDVLGLLPFQRDSLGIECAGKVVAVGEGVTDFTIGEAVVALASSSFSQYVTVPAVNVVAKPDALSFAEAAAIPCVFLTAHYALNHLAKISAGQRVLIHAAAGGVGLAAVQLAQQAGAEIFATASPGKWAFLKSLGVQHLMNSRTLDFADDVMRLTNGEGVDIVLNSLSGDFIPKSLSVLNRQGQFLEIGKRDIWQADQVAQMKPEVTYFLIDLLQMIKQEPELLQTMLQHLMQQFQQGNLKPLPLTTFPIEDAVEAFRYMQQARHIGKIVLTPPRYEAVSAPNIIRFRGDRTYLITGGLGGLGLLLAGWMGDCGARHLVLVGRSNPKEKAVEQLQNLERAGIQVTVAQADVSHRDEIARVLTRIKHFLPPLQGIIHAAGVLDDGILLQQTPEKFARVMAPKVTGAWNIHTLTQDESLDFFIFFSSTASLLGSTGQANHSAANAFLDALAHFRRARGLPALSINWGAWAEVGAATRHITAEWERAKGMGAMSPQQGLQILEYLFSLSMAQIGAASMHWSSQLFQRFQGNYLSSFFADIIRQKQQPTKERQSLITQDILQTLQDASEKEQRDALIGYLRVHLGRILGLSSNELPNVSRSFNELGFDSLMGVELRNQIATQLGVSLPIEKYIGAGNIHALADLILEQLTLPK